MMDSSKVNFDNILAAISEFSAIIKKFAAMLREFVASWTKVPAAANGDVTVPDIDA